MNKILDNLADLLKVKSLVTLSMTAVMVAMLVGSFNPEKEFVALFSASYGAIIAYFFTKDNKQKTQEQYDNEPKSETVEIVRGENEFFD